MPLELFNTLTGNIEPLYASDGQALRFYCCGPTVYDYGHIGNFRTFLHVDVLRRAIKLFGIGLHHVMNITDVDDKIIRNAGLVGKSIGEFSAKFESAFFEDMDALGVERPERSTRHRKHSRDGVADRAPRRRRTSPTRPRTAAGTSASRASLPTASSPSKDLEGIEDGARVDLDEYDKDSARDFALWKATKPGETSLGYAAWPRPSRLAHRVLRPWP